MNERAEVGIIGGSGLYELDGLEGASALALEAGASSGTRMRAGVEANALIPRSLRRVIEGAYIEGFVGSKNQGGQAQATGGVLVDLYFPRRVVAEGSWELPNNWSVETTWEP